MLRVPGVVLIDPKFRITLGRQFVPVHVWVSSRLSGQDRVSMSRSTNVYHAKNE